METMPEDGRKVLVTGGAGFIGSHVADAHLERGDRVWIVDDLSSGRMDTCRREPSSTGWTSRTPECAT